MSRPSWHRYWLPRQVHPGAWWSWALGLCLAASWTTNPLLLGLLVAVVVWLAPAQQSTFLVLAAAAAAQLGDVAIGVVHRVPGMVMFPLAVAVLHLTSVTYLL